MLICSDDLAALPSVLEPWQRLAYAPYMGHHDVSYSTTSLVVPWPSILMCLELYLIQCNDEYLIRIAHGHAALWVSCLSFKECQKTYSPFFKSRSLFFKSSLIHCLSIMDPITAAGIGLSATPLTLQVFAGCVKGKLLQLDYSAHSARSELIVRRLSDLYRRRGHAMCLPASSSSISIEQSQLLNWRQKIGLVAEELDKPSRVLQQNRNLIIDVLLEVQALFKDCVVIEAKYDHLMPQKQTSTTAASSSQDTFDQRFPKGAYTMLSKTLGFLSKIPETPKRLQRAVVKKEKFEKLIQKLVDYNASVEALLDSTIIDQLQQMRQQTCMALLQLNSNVSELKEFSMAMQIKPAAAPDRRDGLAIPSRELLSDSGVDIARLADFKTKQVQLDTLTLDATWEPVNQADVVLGVSGEYRAEGKYQDKHVWIEWKNADMNYNPNPRWNCMIESRMIENRMIENRINKPALLLRSTNKPPEFNAPQCLGYFHDETEERYGFLYLKPSNVPQDTPPTSLRMSSGQDSEDPPP